MSRSQVFTQSIFINAMPAVVERCIVDRDLMHRWLNPLLRCEPVGAWNTEIGARSRFFIALPFVRPTLESTVVERSPDKIVWQFDGFFKGRDTWQYQARDRPQGTDLLNSFAFEIPNPIVAFGFEFFAAGLTQRDMKAQLRRLKNLAEGM